MRRRWQQQWMEWRCRLQMCKGQVVSWIDPEGQIWIGFECDNHRIHSMHRLPESEMMVNEIWDRL